MAQTTLRSTVGRHELDQLLSERERIADSSTIVFPIPIELLEAFQTMPRLLAAARSRWRSRRRRPRRPSLERSA